MVAPFILYTLRYRTLGPIVIVSLIVLGSIVSIIPKVVLNLPVAPYEISLTTSIQQAKLSFIHYYAATDQYIVVFVYGLFIGYMIKCKPKINLGKRPALCAIWAGMLLMPFISTNWNEGFKPIEGNFSQFSFNSWFLFSKIMWSLGFGWIMFACCTGRSGKGFVWVAIICE